MSESQKTYTIRSDEIEELARRLAREIMGAMQGRKESESPALAMTFGSLTIDVRAFEARVDDVRVRMKPLEFRVLTVLANNVGIVLSRERLLQSAWSHPEEVASLRVVDACVSRLRSRLRSALGKCCDPIESVREAGYKLKVDLGLSEER